LEKIAGSFRDPSGQVFYDKNNIYRKIFPSFFDQYEQCQKFIYKESIRKKFLINFKKISQNHQEIIIKPEKIPYISYPHEWTFEQYKEAALFHLKFHIFLLNRNFTLKDSTPFNVQFIGSKPVYIDHLSIVEYERNTHWNGYMQFCEMFLYPLLIISEKKFIINQYLNAKIDGLSLDSTFNLLSWISLVKPRIFLHVTLPVLIKKFFFNENRELTKNSFSKNNYINLLNHLHNFINGLTFNLKKTTWDDYKCNNFYAKNEQKVKDRVVIDFIKKNKNKVYIDLGSNTGHYSDLAIKNGAKYVVGFDFDLGALKQSRKIALKHKTKFLPLFLDAKNPTPNMGWAQKERLGFVERSSIFDVAIVLAFEHHLVITNNVPIENFIEWLIKLAPVGLVEFVPKEDGAIKKLMNNREDIFYHYNAENFVNELKKYKQIVNITPISKSGRILVEYR